MGTYGVTHVKKDNKIIALSDSYDGYLSGMGMANMLCIHYLSTPLLKKLFDQYSASSKIDTTKTKNHEEDTNDNPVILSQRDIQNVLFKIKIETNNPNATSWMEGNLTDDIRTSTVGFGTLLYLNVNPHYGRDYDYCDYLIDLDNEIFKFDNTEIPFSLIQNKSSLHTRAFCDELFELLPEKYKEIESFYDLSEEENIKKLNEVVSTFFNLDDSIVKEFYNNKENERQEYLAKQNQNNTEPNTTLEDLNDDCQYGGYSIRNADVDAPTLRKIIDFMQKAKIAIHETAFLLKNADWGLDEQYMNGGFRTFSPNSKNPLEHKIYDSFSNIIEYHFKIRGSIYSSSGTWSFNVKQKEDSDISSFFADEVPGPEKTYYNLKEVEAIDENDFIIKELHPFLIYHADYEEIRPIVLSNKTNYNVLWLYQALLKQDKESFDKFYQNSVTMLNQQPKDVQLKVKGLFLQSLLDGIDNNELVVKLGTSLGKNISIKNDADFITHLKTTTFFTYVESAMNDNEKSLYLEQSTTGITKNKNRRYKM